MLDGSVLGTALIGQESVRIDQDLNIPPRPRRQGRRGRFVSGFAVVRRAVAHGLRAVADALEPAPIGRKVTGAES
jgi:hypothetical protein